MARKFIFVTGGNLSSLGKGTSSAALGRLLKARGYRVSILKIDPYLNVDAGTMNPYQHGEVFVTEDGAETDLDLGHYERFLHQNLSRYSNVTTGQVYLRVIENERKGKYLGATVQVIPHVTDEIKSCIWRAIEHDDAEVLITEVGGTVGDIESGPFVEAIRQFRKDVGIQNVMYIHVTLVPYLPSAGEQKTKLTQHSVKELRGLGIQPDVIIARTSRPLGEKVRKKISLYCDVPEEAVIEGRDTDLIYEIPLRFEDQGLAELVCQRLSLEARRPALEDWEAMVERYREAEEAVRIAIVGKYVHLPDAYLSLVEALGHAASRNGRRLEVQWVNAEEVTEENAAARLREAAGVVVPGGFDARGVEGKIAAIRYCREQGVPFLGLCLGLQCAVIEFARNVVGLERANSTEFDPTTPHPVIDLLQEQREIIYKGGTMRLGAYPCHLKPGTLAHRLYGAEEVQERHRHRWEVNNAYRALLEKHGMVFSGIYEEGDLVEILELPDHPYFVATQFHPEFKSRPLAPHPLFLGFVRACVEVKEASRR